MVAPKQEPKTSKPKDRVCLFSSHIFNVMSQLTFGFIQLPVERRHTMKFSDSEDEASTVEATRPQEPPSKRSESKSAVRVKKGVILSDDEDEEGSKPARPKATYKTGKTKKHSDLDAAAESELRAMMDIDDGRRTAFVRIR